MAPVKPEKPVLADIAAERHQTKLPQQKIQNSAMRPSDVMFTAFRTRKRHGRKSPQNHFSEKGTYKQRNLRAAQMTSNFASPVPTSSTGDVLIMLQPE
jgi:hypothetical protein